MVGTARRICSRTRQGRDVGLLGHSGEDNIFDAILHAGEGGTPGCSDILRARTRHRAAQTSCTLGHDAGQSCVGGHGKDEAPGCTDTSGCCIPEVIGGLDKDETTGLLGQDGENEVLHAGVVVGCTNFGWLPKHVRTTMSYIQLLIICFSN